MNTNIILDKLAKTVYNDIVKIFKFRKKGVFMKLIPWNCCDEIEAYTTTAYENDKNT